MQTCCRTAVLLMAALASSGLRAAPIGGGQVPPPPALDIIGFCESRGTVDDPGEAFSPSDYRTGRLPEQIAAVEGASTWRCMSGKVLVCQDSASGDWCSTKDPSLVVSKELKDLCAAEPAIDLIATAMTSYSSSQWRCVEGKPVAFGTLPLDARGFFKVAWVEYVIGADGRPAPIIFPDGVR